MPTAGTRIKAAREKAGLTQGELANLLGTSYRRVIRWEKHGDEPTEKYRRLLAALPDFNGDADEWRNTPDPESQLVAYVEELVRRLDALPNGDIPSGLVGEVLQAALALHRAADGWQAAGHRLAERIERLVER